MLELRERDGTVILNVRVQPRASRNALDGEWQGALKVRLTAPPVDDKANEALRAFLGEVLRIPKSAVRILAGERGRTKRIEIQGVTARLIHDLLVDKA
ncbi:MAG: DUF167 domain-containing protein [Candidatus Acidiferrales bacterium]|jgi:hypothetical protein